MIEDAKNSEFDLILTKEEVVSIFSTSFVLSSPLIITISIGFLALNIEQSLLLLQFSEFLSHGRVITG